MPSRSLLKTILLASIGFQLGSLSSPAVLLMLRKPVPSAFITKISLSPSRLERKAILLPSGDQAGWRLSKVPVVTWVTLRVVRLTM